MNNQYNNLARNLHIDMKRKEKINLTLEDIYSMVESVTKRLLKEGALRAPMKEKDYLGGVKALGFKGRDLEGKNGILWELPNPEWSNKGEKSVIQVQYEPYHDDRKGRVDGGMLDNIKKALLDSLNDKGAFMYNWFLKRDGTPNVDNCQTYINMNNQFHWEQEPIYFGDNVDYASVEKDLKSKEQANAEYANCEVWQVFPQLSVDDCLVWFLKYGDNGYNLCRGENDRRPLVLYNDGQPIWFDNCGPAKEDPSKICLKIDYFDDETSPIGAMDAEGSEKELCTRAYPIMNDPKHPIDFRTFLKENKKYGKSVL